MASIDTAPYRYPERKKPAKPGCLTGSRAEPKIAAAPTVMTHTWQVNRDPWMQQAAAALELSTPFHNGTQNASSLKHLGRSPKLR